MTIPNTFAPFYKKAYHVRCMKPIKGAEDKPDTMSRFGGIPFTTEHYGDVICHKCGKNMVLLMQMNLNELTMPKHGTDAIVQLFVCTTAKAYHKCNIDTVIRFVPFHPTEAQIEEWQEYESRRKRIEGEELVKEAKQNEKRKAKQMNQKLSKKAKTEAGEKKADSEENNGNQEEVGEKEEEGSSDAAGDEDHDDCPSRRYPALQINYYTRNFEIPHTEDTMEAIKSLASKTTHQKLLEKFESRQKLLFSPCLRVYKFVMALLKKREDRMEKAEQKEKKGKEEEQKEGREKSPEEEEEEEDEEMDDDDCDMDEDLEMDSLRAQRDKIGGWPQYAQGKVTVRCSKCSQNMHMFMHLEGGYHIRYKFAYASSGQIFQCPTHPDKLDFSYACLH